MESKTMAVTKIYRPANTNNFESMKPSIDQSEPRATLSVKVLASASKVLTQKSKKQKDKSSN